MEDPDRGDLWRVHDWRESLLHHPPHNDDEGLVARLYLTISDLYKGVLPLLSRRPELPAAAYRKIERGYSSLVLWSHSYGASSGKVDLSLQHSQDLRQITLRLLVNICTAILDRLIPRTSLDQDASLGHLQEHARSTVTKALAVLPETEHGAGTQSTEAERSEALEDSIPRIASNIRTLVQALADLGPLYEEPIADVEARHEPPARLDITTPVANLVSLIKYMFPKCDSTVAGGIAEAVLSTWCKIQENAAAMPTYGQEAETPRPSLQKAKTLVETLFHDSGIGTSIRSSYAETVRCYHVTSDNPVKVQLPRMPDKTARGDSFRCETCHCYVRVSNEREWKRHLMRDASPYMCIELSCPRKFQPYSTREEWIAHIDEHYSTRTSERSAEQLRCPICGFVYPGTDLGITEIATHLAHHLEPIAAEVIIPGVTFTGPDEGGDETSTPENEPGRSRSMDGNANLLDGGSEAGRGKGDFLTSFTPGRVELWSEHQTADGHVYYFDTMGRTSQWAKPEGKLPPYESWESERRSADVVVWYKLDEAGEKYGQYLYMAYARPPLDPYPGFLSAARPTGVVAAPDTSPPVARDPSGLMDHTEEDAQIADGEVSVIAKPPGHKKGPWSKAEDAQLLSLVRQPGARNWVRIAQQLGTRTPKQCRQRYHRNLEPYETFP